MDKIKKIIPIFLFIFSIFFIGNSKIKASSEVKEGNITNVYLGSSKTNSNFNSENFKIFLKKFTDIEFMKEQTANSSPSNAKYYNAIYDYTKNGSYKEHGKYYFASATSTINARRVFITDYPEQIKVTSYNFSEINITAYYDKDKPVYVYNPGGSSGIISSNTSYVTDGYFDSNFSKVVFNSSWYGDGNFWSNIPEIKLADNIKFSLSDATFEPGTIIFYGSESGILSTEPSAPTLSYKNSFISNEDYDKLGKVSIEFSENDESISKYNYAQFKLQYGSNDFKQENIPIFSHYKVFGRTNSNTNWEEVDPKTISYNDESMDLKITDTTYDYVENSLADSTITIQMDFMKSLNSLYENWKIEYYFDNTQNGYFYTADTLKESKWTDTSKFLENYIYYEFPNDKMYAFISSENEKNSGKIYFPTNSIENEEIKINFKYFNLKNKLYDNPLSTIIYEEDNYYSYINFNFNNKESILAVNRRKGSHVVNTYGKDILSYYKSWFGLNKKIIPNEITYFYVPIGYKVYFSNGKDITQVKTVDGYVDINNSENTDYFNSSNDIDSISDLFKYISFEKNNKLISLINEMYNKFRNSLIGGYIYLILITSIIILVIKAMKR